MTRVILLLAAVFLVMVVLLGVIVRIGANRVAGLDGAAEQSVPPTSSSSPVVSPATPRSGAPASRSEASNGSERQSSRVNPNLPRQAKFPIAAPARLPIILPAAAAVLHGQLIHLQTQGGIQDIGFWDKPEDFVEWTTIIPQGGLYHVEIVYACENGHGGGLYELTIGKHRFTGTSAHTGTWEDYQTLSVGDLSVDPGPIKILLKPLHLEPGKALMNVRSVRLVPVGK